MLEPLADAAAYRVALLKGVTGSGKTEIYLALADRVRRQGRQALLLVPEIALTPALAGRVRARFGDRVAIQHSGLSDGERHDQWHRVRGGEVDVVVGTRSAVFAPFERVGLIVVDEEHDTSYKQDETPRYHGRDVAIVRGKQQDALVVLGSATPSLESFHNAMRGRYTLVSLDRRVADRPMADVHVVNMRDEWAAAGADVTLSGALVDGIERRLAAGEQALVLLNRRGISSAVLCRQCGNTVECPHCSVSMTVHGSGAQGAGPLSLLRLRPGGAGRVSAVRGALPRAPRRRHRAGRAGPAGAVSRRADRTRRPRHRVDPGQPHRHPRQRSDGARLDVLVGTQMIAKGHDFPVRDAGRRRLGRRRPRPAGLPRRRAHVPAHHAGRRPGRARRPAGRGVRADVLPDALRGAAAAARRTTAPSSRRNSSSARRCAIRR